MHKVQPICLSSLIEESKDGEWGKGECPPNHSQMLVIRGTDFDKVKSGTINGIPKRCIPNAIAHRKKLKPNDILIETAGGTEDKPTGRVTFISEEYLNRYKQFNFTCASFSRFIRIDSKKANPLFIYWYLQFLYDARISYMFHTQHTGVARFQWTKFSICNLFVLPDRRIQKRIASVLISYDELIEVNNQRIKLLEETATQLYKEWFVRMRFPGFKETRFEKGIPDGWEVKRIANAFEVLGGGTPSTEKDEYWNGDINWFTPTDITSSSGIFLSEASDKITENGLKKSSSKLFPAYCVMMTSRATIGAIGINTTPGCTNQGFITCLPNEDLPYTFLYYFILFNKETFEMLASGSTFLEITKGTFKKINMLIPEKGIVKKFHQIAEPTFQQIENLQQQNIELREIRDRLLPRLISGKLQVKDVKVESHNEEILKLAAEPEPLYN